MSDASTLRYSPTRRLCAAAGCAEVGRVGGQPARRGSSPLTLATHPPLVHQHAEGRAELAIWQGRFDEARAAVRSGPERVAGAEEDEFFRDLLTLGLRAEADRAEQARARRLPADKAVQVGTVLLDQLREVAGRAAVRGVDPAAAPASLHPEPSPAERLGLTRREQEVLALVAAGRTNRQIAEELFISVKTAGIHVSNILAKLGVASRVEAATTAHRAGLVDDPAS
jgi:DNA-binding CsgD family transcriptional regulator